MTTVAGVWVGALGPDRFPREGVKTGMIGGIVEMSIPLYDDIRRLVKPPSKIPAASD